MPTPTKLKYMFPLLMLSIVNIHQTNTPKINTPANHIILPH